MPVSRNGLGIPGMCYGVSNPQPRIAEHTDVLPAGWQRIGDRYRRADGFMLEAQVDTGSINRDLVGLVVLWVVGPGDWLFFSFGEFCGGARSAFVGNLDGKPNTFAFWMDEVDRAIPLIRR